MISLHAARIILFPATKCSRESQRTVFSARAISPASPKYSRACVSLRKFPFVCIVYAYSRNRPCAVKIKSCTKVAQAFFDAPFPAPLNRPTFPEFRAFQPLFPPALTKKNTRSLI